MMRLAELTSPGLEALRERRPIALWPVGAVEPHGPHAPLGTDTLISVGMCERAAARLDDPPAVVLPALAFGVTRYGAAFAGAIGISEATLRAVVLDVAASLDAAGLPPPGHRQQPLRARAGRDAARRRGRRRRALPRPRAPPQRAAAHRRVPPRLLPRGALRDVARARRRAAAGRLRGGGACPRTRSTCPRRWPPGAPTSSRWAWIARTAARPRRPAPRRAARRSRR